MIKYIKDKVERINQNLANNKFSICVLREKKGFGKTTIAKKFVAQYNSHHITINRCSPHENHLATIANSLSVNTYDFNILYEEIVKHLGEHVENIVTFLNAESYQDEVLRFIANLSNHCINNSLDRSTIFVFTVNDTGQLHTLNNYFHQYRHYVEYIDLPKWHQKDLLELFQQEFPNNLVDKKDIESIIDNSFSNPQDFISHLEELKRRNIFMKNAQGYWALQSFDKNILALTTGKMVRERYDQLEPGLKETIQKASIIGNEFDVATLEDPLKVKQGQHLLTQIEDISKLIYRPIPDELLYSFENADAHMSINGYVLEDDRIKWNIAIGEYFMKKIEGGYITIDEQNLDNFLRKAAYYFKEASDYVNATACYLKLIVRCYVHSNYNQAIMFVEELNKISSDNIPSEAIRMALLYKMKSNEVLNNFEHALQDCNELVQMSYSEGSAKTWITTKKAHYLYYTNKVSQAYSLLSPIIIRRDFTKLEAELYANIFSLFSAIQQTMGNREYIRNYNFALDLAKKHKLKNTYYNLLRKANSVHRGEPGVMLMKESYDYYKNCNNLYEQAMVAHNIGTEYLCLLRADDARRYLDEANMLLKKIGSTLQVYAINSIAIHHMLFANDYKTALDILSNVNLESLDNFDSLAIINNIATCKRKLGLIFEAKKLIDEIERINNSQGTNFAWYNQCIILQKGCINKEQGLHEEALRCFLSYFEFEYEGIKADKVFAIKNVVYLSKILGRDIPEKLKQLTDAYDACGEVLFNENIIFSDLLFWE